MYKILLLFLAICQLCGCASIFSNSAYPVFIDSNAGQAEFVIKNRNGVEVSRGQTPAMIILESGAGYFKGAAYTLHISKPGYEAADYRLNRHIDWVYFTNIFNIVGFFIDPATGAMWALPQETRVDLTPTPRPDYERRRQ